MTTRERVKKPDLKATKKALDEGAPIELHKVKKGEKMSKEKDKIHPLDDRIVVEPLEAEEKTAGGILLPDSAKQKPQRGRVVAIGPGKMLESGQRAVLAVAKGDEVLYGKYTGNDIKLGAKEVKILRESDILAKIVK